MNGQVNIKTIWRQCTALWGKSMGAVALIVLSFFIGGAVERKSLVDDCKFAGAFRDGSQPFLCQPTVRIPR